MGNACDIGMAKRTKEPTKCARCGDAHPPCGDCHRYNGWSNYETWAAKLWIDNEEPSYLYWREAAAQAFASATACGVLTRVDVAANALRERLKEEHEERIPESVEGFYSDMLQAALDSIDWYEIARSLLDDREG